MQVPAPNDECCWRIQNLAEIIKKHEFSISEGKKYNCDVSENEALLRCLLDIQKKREVKVVFENKKKESTEKRELGTGEERDWEFVEVRGSVADNGGGGWWRYLRRKAGL
jgi:hypothetical protein